VPWVRGVWTKALYLTCDRGLTARPAVLANVRNRTVRLPVLRTTVRAGRFASNRVL